MLIPLSDAIKTKVDVVTVSGATLGFMSWIPWPTVAAILSSLYLVLRIIDVLVGWFKKRRK